MNDAKVQNASKARKDTTKHNPTVSDNEPASKTAAQPVADGRKDTRKNTNVAVKDQQPDRQLEEASQRRPSLLKS